LKIKDEDDGDGKIVPNGNKVWWPFALLLAFVAVCCLLANKKV